MFCSQCWQANSNDAKFCSNCGNKLENQNTQFSQKTQKESLSPRQRQVELWNPNAAANWSLLFSPAFGAYLHMKNWEALGDNDKAKSSKSWFISSIILSILGLGFFVLVAWYFSIGKKQTKYVKEKFGDRYTRKSWGAPLLIGFSVFIVCIFLILLIPENNHQQQKANQVNEIDWKNGIITPPSSSLTCGENSGSSPKGLEFYGPISYNLSDNNPVKTQVTWGVKYADSNLQNDSYSGSLRIRLYAVSESYSGSSLNGYVIGEYFPNFNGDGSASTNQLKVNYNVENIVSKDEKNLKIPSGKYCTVITLEEFDEQSCSSTDRFCIQSWMQFKDPATFF